MRRNETKTGEPTPTPADEAIKQVGDVEGLTLRHSITDGAAKVAEEAAKQVGDTAPTPPEALANPASTDTSSKMSEATGSSAPGTEGNTDEGKAAEKPATREDTATASFLTFSRYLTEMGKLAEEVTSAVAADASIDLSWATELPAAGQKLRDGMAKLASSLTSRENITDANRKMFFQSPEYAMALKVAEALNAVVRVKQASTAEDGTVTEEEVLNPETGGLPENLFASIFAEFQNSPKGYKGEGMVPLGTMHLTASLVPNQAGRPQTIPEGRPPQGYTTRQASGETSGQIDKEHWFDRAHPERGGKFSADLFWLAYREEGPAAVYLTEAEKAVTTYYRKNGPSDAMKRLEREGKVTAYQGEVTRWAKSQGFGGKPFNPQDLTSRRFVAKRWVEENPENFPEVASLVK